MTRKSLVVVWAVAFLLVCFDKSIACEVDVPCESVREIVVLQGTKHLPEGVEEVVYVACVYLEAIHTRLKEVLEDCPDPMLSIVGHKFKTRVPRIAISTDGSWFSIIRSTPEEALEEGMNLCPGKVRAYLSGADSG